LSQFKEYHPSENLKFNNLGIFQSLKLRNLVGKILPKSLKLNFTPNTLGCYEFISLKPLSDLLIKKIKIQRRYAIEDV